jgi:hypothetical protein
MRNYVSFVWISFVRLTERVHEQGNIHMENLVSPTGGDDDTNLGADEGIK